MNLLEGRSQSEGCACSYQERIGPEGLDDAPGGAGRMITTDWTPDLTNLLCDLIAEDRTFSQAARIMRLSKNAVIGKFARIRRAYGRQGL